MLTSGKDKLQEDFPYWERLHGFWHTLPNFNPVTVTSNPGQDLEADAMALFDGGLGDVDDTEPAHDTFTPEEQAEINLDKDADGDDDNYVRFYSSQEYLY